MLFQALDDKKDCIGVYAEGELHFQSLPSNLSHTWDFPTSICAKNLHLAKIYCGGKSLTEVCPVHLKPEYDKIHHKMLAFYKSFANSKVSLDEHCFYDLVPKRSLLEYFSVKNQICESVFENYEKPENHDFLLKVLRMTKNISLQEFPLDRSSLSAHLADQRVRAFRNSLGEASRVKYEAFGTVTGRLTTAKDSFPILTLDKKYRKVIKPKNDWLVELDFNAAELRTLLGLSGTSQPQGDIHDWNLKNLFKNLDIDRAQAKEKIFSWLYNPKSVNKEAERYYCRDELVKKYFDGFKVNTPMGRKIPADERRALNYLIQSTSSDVFLNSAYHVWQALEGKKSEVRFLVHDSVLIDFSEEDREVLSQVIELFSKTPLGKYKVGVSIGKSYGEMRKMK